MKYTIPMLLSWALCMVPGLAQGQDCGETVTVDAGDTLYEIAQECDTSVSAMVAANNEIDHRNVIRVGWTLTVPNGDQAPPVDQPDPDPAPQPGAPQANYTVRAGDTLAEIAARHDLSLSALLEANPQINNPNVIDVGLTLRIPDGDGREVTDPRRPTWSGNVSIEPNSGAPGTRVRVRASGFPSTTAVNIGAGPVGSEYEVVRSNVRTNANGGLVARAELPEYADAQDQWVFVVETDDHRTRGRSEPFNVRASDGNGGGSRVVVRGQLTGDGVECPAVRGQDGTLYTLAGDTGRFAEGDYVRIEGSVAEVSVCMLGTTISVDRIMVWKEGAGAGDDEDGDDNLRRVLGLEGVLRTGAECPVLRTDDGETYGLTGDLEGFEASDRVYVEATQSDASNCMEGTTLSVRSIRSAR